MPTGNLDYEDTDPGREFHYSRNVQDLDKVTGNMGPDQEAHIVLRCEEAPVTGNSVDVE